MSWLDRIPSHERMAIRKRLRSPEEYERLREKVKGPEDLEKEMNFNESVAEFAFALESEPALKEALRNQLTEDMKENGMDTMLEGVEKLDDSVKSSLENGKFTLSVQSHPQTHQDQLTVLPEGVVSEKIPVQKHMSDTYVSQLQSTT